MSVWLGFQTVSIQIQKRWLQVYDTLANGQKLCFNQLRILDTEILSIANISTYIKLATANDMAASQGGQDWTRRSMI